MDEAKKHLSSPSSVRRPNYKKLKRIFEVLFEKSMVAFIDCFVRWVIIHGL
jgi:hypothetical protein